MQLLLLGMIAAVFVHDDVLDLGRTHPLTFHPALTISVMLLTKAAVLGPFAWFVRRTQQNLAKPKGRRALRKLERLLGVVPVLLLLGFLIDLALGWLVLLRDVLGNVILADELLSMLPTLLAVLGVWALHHPIDRRVREATIIRRADQGMPLYPLWTRGQYVLTQARHQLGIILAPLLAILAWSESVQWFVESGRLALNLALWITPLGAGLVFLFTPPLLRHVFDTVPLPAGTVRDTLAHICQQHRVGVRDLLLWRTGGHVINAAVMGLVAPLRYVLMTDGLLDQLRRPHVEAVMAHELGHVKHKHLVWLVLIAGAWMAVLFSLAEAFFIHVNDALWVQGVGVTAALIGWVLGFGWVSRRIERQADTFAAKHMSTFAPQDTNPPEDEAGTNPFALTPSDTDAPEEAASTVFTGRGVLHVVEALQCVADLNHISAHRPSWRHGSIARRQKYLHSLIGRPLDAADVDRTMRHIRWVTAAVLIGLIVWVALGD